MKSKYKFEINEYQKKYYQKNRDKIKKRHRKYNQDNKKVIKKYIKKYRIKNKYNIKKQRKVYYQKNKSYLNKQQEKYRKKYPERNSAHVRVNRKKLRDKKCLRCRSRKNLDFHHTNYEKDEGFTLCRKCHKKIEYLKKYIKVTKEELGSILFSNNINKIEVTNDN